MKPISKLHVNVLLALLLITFQEGSASTSGPAEEMKFSIFFSANVAGELEACG